MPQKCGHRVTALCLVCTMFTDGLVHLPKQILRLCLSRRGWEASIVYQSGPLKISCYREHSIPHSPAALGIARMYWDSWLCPHSPAALGIAGTYWGS